MSGIIYTRKIISHIKEVQLELQHNNNYSAYKKIKLILDSLIPICYVYENNKPLKLPENHLELFKEWEKETTDEENLSKEGIIAGKIISPLEIIQTLEKARYLLDQKKIEATKKILIELVAGLNKKLLTPVKPKAGLKSRQKTELMITILGTKETFVALKGLLVQYNLADKRISEFSELDKLLFQNIKQFAMMI